MPTYDYACDGCGHTFEEWQSFKDEVLTKCPSCKKNKLRRLFGGGAAIIFKGSGFYETDYRRKDESKKSGKSADSETKSESTPAKTDSSASDSNGKKTSSGKEQKTGS